MSLEMALFARSRTSSYWDSIVTMAMYFIISEIKQDIGRKVAISHPNLHSVPRLGVAVIILP